MGKFFDSVEQLAQAAEKHGGAAYVDLCRYVRDEIVIAKEGAGTEMSPNDIYAEGRSDQIEDDRKVVALLLENCDDADRHGDGRLNTTRIRELLGDLVPEAQTKSDPHAEWCPICGGRNGEHGMGCGDEPGSIV